MKKVAVLLLMFVSGLSAFGQSSQILPNSIQLPHVNGTSSITNPANGMLVFNLPDQSLYYRKENEWVRINNRVNNNVVTNPGIYYKITTAQGQPAIPGEITTGDHAGQTMIQYIDYSVMNEVAIGSTSGGAGAGKPSINTINIIKYHGTNSTPLFRSMVLGAHFESMEFYFYDENDQLYYAIKLSMVFVQKILQQNPDGMETITLLAGKIGWKDFATNPITGTFSQIDNTYTNTW